LKEVLVLQPDHAAAHYLLAAEHAELGLMERAADGMVEALKLEPGLEIARFQLGLLYVQLGRSVDAREMFSTLSDANDDALRAFAQAFQALLNDNQADAIHYLNEGLAACDNNPALKGDMTRVLNNLTTPLAEASDAQPKTADVAPASSEAAAVFLGAYRDSIEKL
jgi:tetratricopeptide (TPR) repeat protein